MPYVSQAQERWAHTPSGRSALGDKLAEFDAASKGLKLPARAPGAKKAPSDRAKQLHAQGMISNNAMMKGYGR